MATRDVQLRLTTTGLDDAIAKFDALSKKLDSLKLSMDELSAKKATPSVSIDGLDASLAKVAVLKAALDDLNHTSASANVSTEGTASSILKKALSDAFPLNSGFASLGGGRSDGMIFREEHMNQIIAKEISSGVGKMSFTGGGAFGFWRNLFGAGGSAGGSITGSALGDLLASGQAGPGNLTALASGEQSGGSGVTAQQGLIGGGIALGLSLLPSFVPFAIGALTGGAGAYGAFDLASKANTQQTTLQNALNAAVATNKASPTTANYQAVIKASTALTNFRRKNQSALGLYSAGQGVLSDVSGLFTGALNANQTETTRQHLTGPGKTGSALVSHAIGGTSFMAGIGKITSQVGSFVKTVGVQNLGETFRASLPFIQTVVKSLEDFINLMGPAATEAMKEFKPYLPIIRQGFKELSQGIADFIKYLGPGMKSSAVIFKAVMDVVKVALIVVSVSASSLAIMIRNVGTAFRDMGHFIAVVVKDSIKFFETFGKTVARLVYTDPVSAVEKAKTAFIHFFTVDIPSWISDAIKWFESLPGKITSALSQLPGELLTIGEHIIEGLIQGIENRAGHLLSEVGHLASSIAGSIGRFFGIGSPSKLMRQYGQYIGDGFALGLNDSHAKVLTSAMNLASKVPGAMAISGGARAGGTAAIPISIQLQLSNDLMQVISKNIRVMGGDPRILIRKVQVI